MKRKKKVFLKVSVIIVIVIFLLTVFIGFISVLIPASSIEDNNDNEYNIIEETENKLKMPNIFESLDIKSNKIDTEVENITGNVENITGNVENITGNVEEIIGEIMVITGDNN